MTDDRMALKAALEKASDAELLSHMLGFVAEKLMSLDVDALCNASRGPASEAIIAMAIVT